MKKILKSSLIIGASLIGAIAFSSGAYAEDGGDRPNRPGRGDRAEFRKKADANGDGKISFEEFRKAHLAMLDQRFDKLDRNGDGFLSPEDRIGRGDGKGRPGRAKPEGGDGAL